MGYIRPPFGEIKLVTPATPTSGTLTVVDNGVEGNHITEATFSGLPLVTPAGNAALAGGHLLFTLPSGNLVIKSCVMNVNLTEASGDVNAAITPDLGVGTTKGTGASATLNLVDSGAGENILTGQTASALNSTTRTLTSLNTILARLTAAAHTVHLNAAATWTNAGAAVVADGKIVIEWAYMD